MLLVVRSAQAPPRPPPAERERPVRDAPSGAFEPSGTPLTRGDSESPRDFVHDGPKSQPVFLGQILGPSQMRQQRRERAVAQHLRQRTQPPADELVTVQHCRENMHVKRSIAPHVTLGLHPIEKLLHRGVLGRLPPRIQDVRNCRIDAGPWSHRIRKTASSDSVMSCAGRPIILLASSRFV